MEVVRTANRLVDLHQEGAGFLFNDLRRIASYRFWGTLHKANCQQLINMAIGSSWTDKYWFSTRAEAVNWINQQIDPHGRQWRSCTGCNP
jgi:hypothetical protein